VKILSNEKNYWPDFTKEIIDGANALDELVPDWRKKVTITSLQLESGLQCVLGQTFAEHYEGGMEAIAEYLGKEDWDNEMSAEYGFDVHEDDVNAWLNYQYMNDPSTHHLVLSAFDDPRRDRARNFLYSALTEQWQDFIMAERKVKRDVTSILKEAVESKPTLVAG